MSDKEKKVKQAVEVLKLLGLPREQTGERSALTLLALLDLKPSGKWSEIANPLIGITPIMEWVREQYGKEYAPNSRETFRRYTMHQFISAGIALQNPDKPDRPVNSPKAVYQIEPTLAAVLSTFETDRWSVCLDKYLLTRQSLKDRFAKARAQNRIPVRIANGKSITLSPGEHSDLIRLIIEDFAERFAPESVLVYVGDTGAKFAYFDRDCLAKLGVELDAHGKMPDVVLYWTERNWLLLVESVTSHGPIDGKRQGELKELFQKSKAGLVFVTAFMTRAAMARYLGALAWETDVWIAESPSHLIHLNGERFLGPY